MRIVFCILTCANDTSRSKRTALKASWLQSVQAENYLFFSDAKNDAEGLIGFDSTPGYEHIGRKFIDFFRNLHKAVPHDSWDWIMFVDDDTFVFTKALTNFLRDKSPTENVAYGYHYEFAPGNDFIPKIKGTDWKLPTHYVSGGAGTVLSKAACLAIKSMLCSHSDPPHTIYSDVSFGFWYRLVGTRVIGTPGFNPEKPCSFKHDEETIRKQITYHRFSPEELIDFNKYA